MPHKNTIRKYVNGGYYHIYNRGVEKRKVFETHADYKNFTSIIISYLTPKPPLGERPLIKQEAYWRAKLEKDEVELVGYCLLPNHFHLLLKQNSIDGVTKFMRRISNTYVKYFNKKYDRQGTLFQGKFKAALIRNETYLLHLSRYIHLNPLDHLGIKSLKKYQYSSYRHYLKIDNQDWIHRDIVLDFFHKETEKNVSYFKSVQKLTYQYFVESGTNYHVKIDNLSLD